jgi:hypothetical protein
MKKMVEYIKFDELVKRRRGTKHIAKGEDFDGEDDIDNNSGEDNKHSGFDTEFSSESGSGREDEDDSDFNAGLGIDLNWE